jgi:predicted dehydrogenase/glycosyltransferase involved in cell wall biosynthesis
MPEPLSVLLATDSPEPSGLGRHMLTLGRGLAPSHRVTLAFPMTAAGFAAEARAAGLEARTYAQGAESPLLEEVRPQVLHLHAGIGWEGHGLARAGAAAGVRVVRTEHLPWLISDPAQEAAFAAAAAMVDAFIAVSDAAAATWAGALARLRPGARLAAIRNGVEPPPARRSRGETRAVLGVPADAPVILCVGRFTPQKDQRTLIRAVRALAPAPLLLLAGDGPERAACEAEAEGCDRIRFLGHRRDVGDLIRAADLLALPSRFEGLPLVVLEAMALGLPVVATRIDSVLEALGPAHPYLAAAGDADDLAAALAAALSAPEAAAATGRAQRERFEAGFTAARMTAETAALYRSVVRPAGRRSRGSSMSRLRIGFVGAGGIAHRHLGVLGTFEDVDVVGIADPDSERARGAAERAGAQAFPSHEALLSALELDAVWICVPPFAHGAPELAAIGRGLPFFVEKPLSLDAERACEIDEAVRRLGLTTAVGYHWRYLDTVDEARRLLRDNPAHLMSGYWLDQTPPPAWWHQEERSGGQIVEQATHVIDLARFLAGDVVEVYGAAAHRSRADFPGLDVPTASTATLRFASGAIANLSATCLLRWNHRVGLHVFADALALELTDHELMVDVGRGRPVRGAEGDPVWRQDRAFLDAVRGEENRIRTPYAEALQTHLVALAVARSARTGLPVRMEGLRADPQPIFRPGAAESARVA